MQIALSDIHKYLSKDLTKEKVLELFEKHVFEIDEIIEENGDVIFEVDVLPNRSSDCLSVRGLLKELSVLSGVPFKDDILQEDLPEFEKSSNTEAQIKNGANVYILAEAEDIRIGNSPKWLADFLEKYGQRSINNLVDITNFVLLFLGQPMHVFDRDKLKEGSKVVVSVKNANKGDSFVSLDGKRYELQENDLVIFDELHKTPIALAGVKGGAFAEIDENTKNILFEVAKFDPKAVRLTSRRLNLLTDAAKRFENDVPDKLPLFGLYLAQRLLREVFNKDIKLKLAQDIINIKENEPINIDTEKISQILGVQVSDNEVTDILSRLGFTIHNNKVIPPFWRTDIHIQEDLAEEIGRIKGLENIPSQPIKENLQVEISDIYIKSEHIRKFFYKKGFIEVTHSTLTDKGELKLKNALASDKNYFRDNISLQMQKTLEKNESFAPIWGEYKEIKLFEIGTVYKDGKEQTNLCIGILPLKKKKREKTARQIKEEILSEFASSFHLKGDFIQNSVFIAEINLDKIALQVRDENIFNELPILSNNVQFNEISPYPFVLRDIAFWADKNEPAYYMQIIKNAIKEKQELLKRIDLFDIYEKDNKISFAYHLVFQSNTETLTDEYVNSLMQKIEQELQNNNCIIR